MFSIICNISFKWLFCFQSLAGKNQQLTQRKCENVSQSKVREVEVSGRPHELVVEDDDAGG